MTISHQSRTDLEWWFQNVCLSYKLLSGNPPDLVLKSDGSKFGWGGVNEESGEEINGLWHSDQYMLHINHLELLAGFCTLKGLVENLRDSQNHQLENY